MEQDTQKKSQRLHLPELDVLRFCAFFLVFVHHFATDHSSVYPTFAHYVGMWNLGQRGVDLFFCLSAFLITLLLLMEISKTGGIAYGRFYARRSLRIWPLYYFLLLFEIFLLLGYGEFLGMSPYDPYLREKVSQQVPAFLVFCGNFSVGHYGIVPSTRMSMLWTISIEEQFYLFWPLLLLLFIKLLGPERLLKAKTGMQIALLLFVVTVLCRITFLQLGCSNLEIGTNTICRLDPLILGCLTAFIWHSRDHIEIKRPWILLAAAFTIASLSNLANMYFHSPLTVIWEPTVNALISIMIIIFAMSKSSSLINGFFSSKALVWLGKISYGLYVFHNLCLHNTEKLLSTIHIPMVSWLGVFFIGLLLTIAISALSYYYFEKPFLALKERLAVIKSRKI